jgi:serine/threonine protein kinase
MAPEVFKKEKYDQRVDVWALGVVLYYMLALEHPFNSNNIQDLAKQVMHKTPKPIVGYVAKQTIF